MPRHPEAALPVRWHPDPLRGRVIGGWRRIIDWWRSIDRRGDHDWRQADANTDAAAPPSLGLARRRDDHESGQTSNRQHRGQTAVSQHGPTLRYSIRAK